MNGDNKIRSYQWVIGLLMGLIIIGLVGVVGDTRGEIKSAKVQIEILQKDKVGFSQYRIDLARLERKMDKMLDIVTIKENNQSGSEQYKKID